MALFYFRSQRDTLTFSCRICLHKSELITPPTIGSCLGNQVQTIILSPPCFIDGMKFLCWNVFAFCVCYTKCFSFKPKILILNSSSIERFSSHPLDYPCGLEQTVDGSNILEKWLFFLRTLPSTPVVFRALRIVTVVTVWKASSHTCSWCDLGVIFVVQQWCWMSSILHNLPYR